MDDADAARTAEIDELQRHVDSLRNASSPLLVQQREAAAAQLAQLRESCRAGWSLERRLRRADRRVADSLSKVDRANRQLLEAQARLDEAQLQLTQAQADLARSSADHASNVTEANELRQLQHPAVDPPPGSDAALRAQLTSFAAARGADPALVLNQILPQLSAILELRTVDSRADCPPASSDRPPVLVPTPTCTPAVGAAAAPAARTGSRSPRRTSASSGVGADALRCSGAAPTP